MAVFGRPILGTDGLGTLEGHVLEHVGDADFAARAVDRTGIDAGVEGELGDAPFEIAERLRGEEYGLRYTIVLSWQHSKAFGVAGCVA